MYKCNTCNNSFHQPDERTVDAGGIRDAGVIGKTMVTFITFCPHCSSRNFVKEERESEATEETDKGSKGVLIGTWAKY